MTGRTGSGRTTRIAFGALWLVLGASVASAADPDHGAALAGKWCVGCHGVTTADRATDITPPTFPQIARKHAAEPAYVSAFLAKPHAPMPPMPLSNREREDLTAFIMRLGQSSRDE